MIRRLSLLLALAGILVGPQSAIAQTAILREYGELTDTDYFLPQDESPDPYGFEDVVPERYEGDMAEAQVFDAYTFIGKHGQQVRITAQSISFDTIIVIGTGDGMKMLERNDDVEGNGFNTNSQIVTTLPLDGEYLIIISSYAPKERGSYVLSVTDIGEVNSPADATLRRGGECAIVRCPD